MECASKRHIDADRRKSDFDVTVILIFFYSEWDGPTADLGNGTALGSKHTMLGRTLLYSFHPDYAFENTGRVRTVRFHKIVMLLSKFSFSVSSRSFSC